MSSYTPLADGTAAPQPSNRLRLGFLTVFLASALGGMGAKFSHLFSANPADNQKPFYPLKGVDSVLVHPDPNFKGPGCIDDPKLEELVLELDNAGAFMFGSFKLKVGIMAPMYVDLRVFFSNPPILRRIVDQLWVKIKDLKFQRVCGVPYAALPMVSILAVEHNLPLVMIRKERKQYGTGKLIEGSSNPGETILILEDVVTSGLSINETLLPLKSELGVKVTDVVSVMDGEQGGRKNLADDGIRLHSVFKLTEVLAILVKHKRIKPAVMEEVKAYLAANQIARKPDPARLRS
eukprot:gb/GEZN01010958.1/.p1 GENE.gb/GEZN01010958.1/~~gb/GEZN01010958.1/.p1  ORF type:complete len:309 (+),score=45.21 gb/GEZN01010958.1/:54-929(+)